MGVMMNVRRFVSCGRVRSYRSLLRPALLCLAAVAFGAVLTRPALAQPAASPPHQRARLPDFQRTEATRVFFDDVLRQTTGERPRRTTGLAETNRGGPAAVEGSTPPVLPDEAGWSRLVSPVTLEDEVKAIKLEVDRSVTTPTAFASGGHRQVRVHFSLLAVLFAVIEQYDGDVRWQVDAPLARQAFARVARNLRAGGSIQVYQEVKQRQENLDAIVRGARWDGPPPGEFAGDDFVDRTPLMQLLEHRLEANLKSWSASATEFRTRSEALRQEAELTAVIGRVLVRDGMDDADDAEYQALARILEQSAVELAAAAARQDGDAARKAVLDVSRSCVECHEHYR
jgi:hypothetical protein